MPCIRVRSVRILPGLTAGIGSRSIQGLLTPVRERAAGIAVGTHPGIRSAVRVQPRRVLLVRITAGATERSTEDHRDRCALDLHARHSIETGANVPTVRAVRSSLLWQRSS